MPKVWMRKSTSVDAKKGGKGRDGNEVSVNTGRERTNAGESEMPGPAVQTGNGQVIDYN